uniref:B box-type domain-containing protein n=1 Tax=Papio anubis TaxID=9555 RepID=A0A8I5R5Y5_PAPAN
MSSGILQVFQRELTCPIYCGHSFCRPCFYLSCRIIPLLPFHFQDTEINKAERQQINIHLKKMASLARKASLWQFLSSEEQMCGTHRETKKMFCEVDKSLLCLLCSSSQEHRDHKHCPIEWAAEEHREKLLKKMQSLWEKACENHRNLNMETTRTKYWKDYVNLRLEAVRAEYQMPALHHEEEKHNLETLKKKGKDIFHQLHLSKAKMAHRREILRGMYEELKEMCHKPDVELLQVFPCRSESVLLHKPQPLNLELSSGPIAGLMDRLNQCRVHITLHQEEANSHIFRYEILRSMCSGCDHQDVPYITATPRSFLAWGAQTFTSGKYYWVPRLWGGLLELGFWCLWREGLFLLGCVKNDIQCRLFTTSPLMLQYISRPTSRVGLFLDYEAKTVSFVDVNQSSLIYTIPNCSFSPPLRPVFCCICFEWGDKSGMCSHAVRTPLFHEILFLVP